MNELFVNIKVDREERPDLDRIYQIAQQMLTQRGGGWPLTMFLSHDDQRPFFGGTYFPDEARHGMPAFRDLLRAWPPTTATIGRNCGQQSGGADAGTRRARMPPPAATAVAGPRRRCGPRAPSIERSFDGDSAASAARRSFRTRAIERLLRDWYATARDSASRTCRRCTWPR